MGFGLRSVDRHLSVPPEVAWRLLIEIGQWPRWGPSVRRAVLDDGAAAISAGAQGTVWTAVRVPVRFVVTDFEPGRRWAWKVAGVNATGHEVIAAPGGCRVRFEVPWWATAYLPLCAAALVTMDTIARDQSTPGQPQ